MRAMGSRVILMRHGATEWSRGGRWAGSSDLPMSDEGEREVGDLARRLTSVDVDRLWVSPLRRARASAQIYLATSRSDALEAPLVAELHDDWREADFGPFEGLDPDRGDPADPAIAAFRRFLAGEPVEGPEPLATVAERGRAVVERAAALGGTTLLVGHGTIARLTLCSLLGAPLGSFRRLRLATGGLIELEGGPEGLRLRLG